MVIFVSQVVLVVSTSISSMYMYGIGLGVTHKSNKMNAYTNILIRLKDLLKYYIYRLNICI